MTNTKPGRIFVIFLAAMLLWACNPAGPGASPQPAVTVIKEIQEIIPTPKPVPAIKGLTLNLTPTPGPFQPLPAPLVPGVPQVDIGPDGCKPDIMWATSDDTVLVRWSGRLAAGQQEKDINEEEPPEPSILPGSETAPPLAIERRFVTNGEFGPFVPIASGIHRITDPEQAAGLTGGWWNDLASYIADFKNAENQFNGIEGQEIAADDIALPDAYEVFDSNPMAAASWADQYYEIALLLGMGYLDTELQNQQQVEYRVSLEYGNQLTVLGVTCPITVGEIASSGPENVTASSNPPSIMGLNAVPEADSASDEKWVTGQGYRRLVDQSVYVGWKMGSGLLNHAASNSGYNIYKRPVEGNLNPEGGYTKVNDEPVSPGGSMQGGFESGTWGAPVAGIRAVGDYELESPEGNFFEGDEENKPDGYYFVDSNDPEQPQPEGQVYCYAVTAIDLLGVESPKSPVADQVGQNCAAFQDFEPPDAPVEMSAALVNESVELKWYSVEDAVGYSVYRAEVAPGQPYPADTNDWAAVNNGGEFGAEGLYTVFTDNSIGQLPVNDDDEKNYWYRVRSWDLNGNPSALSQPVYVFMRDSFPPKPPLLEIQGGIPVTTYVDDDSPKYPRDQVIPEGPCIRIKIDDDTDYVQIYRALDDGSMELVATIPADESGWIEWCDELGGMPGSVKAEYLAQAHDSDGNYSWSDTYTVMVGDGSPFDAPSIISIVPQAEQPGVVANWIIWNADLSPEFDQFNVYRFNNDEDADSISDIIANGSPQPIAAIPVVQAQNLGNGYASAEFKDAGLPVNSQTNSDFYYVVSSKRLPGGGFGPAEEKFSSPYMAPPGDAGDDLQHALRNVRNGMWCSDHSYEEGVGVRINWDPEQIISFSDGTPSSLSSESTLKGSQCRERTDIDWGAHLIFRSRSEDSGYVQIAPVIGGVIGTNPENDNHPYYGSPDSPFNVWKGGIEYLDEDASFGTYWYVVVTTDPATGEPVSVTPPQRITIASLEGLPADEFADFECRPDAVQKLVTMYAPQTLTFGSGGRYDATVTVCEWTDASEPERGLAKLSGNGYATFTHPDGLKQYRVRVEFEDVRAKESGIVTDGKASGAHNPIVVSGQGRFDYSVEDIYLSVTTAGPNGAKADIRVLMDNSFYLVEDDTNYSYLDLKDTPISSSFDFSATKTLTALPAGASAVSPANAAWWNGIDYLVLDELPVALLVDALAVSPTAITAPGDIVGRYYERFKGRGIQGAVDRVPVNERVNSNDALLQQAVFTVDDFLADPGGINAELISKDGVGWVTSIPYSMKLQADKAQVIIAGSVITEGAVTGTGEAVISYMPKTVPDDLDGLQALNSTFETLSIGKSGFSSGSIEVGAGPYGWIQSGFEIENDFGGDWSVYLPPISSRDLPAQPFKLDKPNDDNNSLWDPLVTQPFWLMPGVNAHGEGEIYWKCLDYTFDAAVDLYVRRGGVSHTIKATGASSGMLHGYKVGITKADLGFLDSELVYHTVGMVIELPFPANFAFAGTVSGFDGGCPTEITDPSSGTEILADHWNLPLLPSVAEFEIPPPEQKHRLFLSGGVNLPHDLDDSGTAVEWVPMRTRWEPDGNSGGTRFSEPSVVSFDGLHYLAKVDNGVNLSYWEEAEPDNLADQVSANANVEDLVCISEANCPGWITYEGTITVPYFGPLVTDDDSEEVRLSVFTPHEDTQEECEACVDYIGSTGLRAKQTWISEAGLELDFPLVVAKRKGDSPGLVLTGIEQTSVLPEGLIQDWDLEMIRFDSSVVIDSGKQGNSLETNSTIFLGLSSLPASIRAVAETLGVVEDDTSPVSTDLDRWFNRQEEEGALDAVDRRLYVGAVDPDTEEAESVGGCESIVQQIWPGFSENGNKTYKDTYEILNNAALGVGNGDVPVGCFDIPAIEAALAQNDDDEELQQLLRLGGGVGSALQFAEDGDDYKLEFNLVRGNIVFSADGPATDFERFDLALRTKIAEKGASNPADSEHIFLATPHLAFSYTKAGDFTIEGKTMQADMFAYKVDKADITLVISTGEGNIGLQGGLTYYDGVEFGVLVVNDISGVFGFGQDVFYVGMNGNGILKLESAEATVGAGLLLGRINGSSITVLENHGFNELVDKFPDIANDPMTGIYARGLGDVPIIQNGCALSLNVGGEVEVWFFTGEQTAYGGSLRGFAYGKALCVISARGDVTLTMYKEGVQQNGEDIWVFEGTGWVCGGLGWCSPGSWGPTWKGRWWGDSWCWQAGAAAEIIWRTGDGWDYSLDADYE